MNEELIGRIAHLRGIGDAYHDYRGELRRFPASAKAAVLRAMGVRVDDDAALSEELAALVAASHALAPRIAVAYTEHLAVDLAFMGGEAAAQLQWRLDLEDGRRLEGRVAVADLVETSQGEIDGVRISRRRFELPVELPRGYHELELSVDGRSAHCRVVAAPARCHEPVALAAGRRIWGVAVQLYTLRSHGNWGIGDFADLQDLVRGFARLGAGFIGLNPLHALALADPEQASPYAASDRRFLDVLYIAVTSVPEFADCARARERVADPRFSAELARLRAGDWVDYRGVAAAKLEILALLHAEFRERQVAAGTPRAAAFAGFVAAGGSALRRHATYDALDGYFRGTLGTDPGWMNWPAEFRDPDGEATRGFAKEHAERIDFHLYLQWLAQDQLAAAQALARSLGMPIGLYGDYAVGAAAAGSEVWSDGGRFRLAAEIGAPPDPLALRGQGWGVPPQDPQAMLAEGLSSFVEVIRANMRRYGALRLDHVMSLFRLWWVPAGVSPDEGLYVHYPLEALMAVLALESERAGCLVIGEDLGVVPDEVRAAMARSGLYHYKVMIFEKDAGRFRRPADYPRGSLATVTTHDLPTIRSYWQGSDIELRERLALYPGDAARDMVRREREHDRAALLAALAEAGLAPTGGDSGAASFTASLAHAMHRFLAGSSAALVALQIEDLLGMSEPVNVPGTHGEYPNWRRKLTVGLESLLERADLAEDLSAVERARG
ncbi:MAG: 4-alpha-glucanotransferase [Gammaproteobacteria bacterium]|nr:4-alpha-glucanotransferase [Gammaproteobacteria bacterium]